MGEARKHIFLLSFPHYGHIIPLLEFGKKVSRHHRVTLAVSEIRLEDMKKREMLTEDPEYDLRIIGIEDGYKKDYDSPSSMAQIVRFVLPATSRFMEAVMKNAAQSAQYPTTIDVVIADVFDAEPASVCTKYGIPLYLFSTASTGFLARALITNEGDATCPEGTAVLKAPLPGQAPEPVTPSIIGLLLAVKNVSSELLMPGIIINSYRDIEAEILSKLCTFPSMKDVATYCVGPLLPEEKDEQTSKFTVQKQVIKWLDSKEQRSVVYVSFGSLAVPEAEQLHEIGRALLALGQPFIFSLPTEYYKYLPKEILDDFELNQLEDPKSQFLVLPWSPQKAILAHSATAVFLSHCGWNSTLESILSGVPIVAWPMFAEQPVNAEWLVKQGLGRLIPGTGAMADRIVPAGEIRGIIADVGGWSSDCAAGPNVFRNTAETWGEIVHAAISPNGSSQKEFLDLVKFNHKKNVK